VRLQSSGGKVFILFAYISKSHFNSLKHLAAWIDLSYIVSLVNFLSVTTSWNWT